MYENEKQRVELLIKKKWLVETDAAHVSYNFIDGKVNIMPDNETCDFIIHQIKEHPFQFRIDIFRKNVTEVWDICAIGTFHMLWANTADEKKGVYRILRVSTS